jgi:hypothetical protein
MNASLSTAIQGLSDFSTTLLQVSPTFTYFSNHC